MSEIRVSTVDSAEWDRLAGSFPDHTVFHLRPWLDSLAAVHRAELVLAMAVAGDRCVAVWPLFESRKGPLRILGSPLPGWATTYLGPLFANEADVGATLEAFFDHPVLRRYAFFSCRTLDQRRRVDFGSFGFSAVRDFSTYWIDLRRGENDLWRGLKSECRSRVRKAQKLGIEIRRESTAGFVDDFWTMSLETFARTGSHPTYTKAFLREMCGRLQETGNLEALSAFWNGGRIATLVLPRDVHTMYYWGGASYQSQRHLPAGNLLHWEAIRIGRERGLAGYDLVSTNGSPGRFKSTFGPSIVHRATHWERSPSRSLALLKNCYERYLRMRLGVQNVREVTA